MKAPTEAQSKAQSKAIVIPNDRAFKIVGLLLCVLSAAMVIGFIAALIQSA